MKRLATLLPLLLDLVVPTAGYFLLHALGMDDVWALTVAGSAAGVTTAVNSVRRRRVDLLGALVCAELVLSVGLALVTDSPRLVLARAALYLAIGGGALLASSAAGRPITYPAAEPMATKGDPVRARAYAAVWDRSAEFRRIHVRLSSFVGIGMLAYAALRLVIVFTVSSVADAVWAQEVPGIVLLAGALGLIRLQVPKLRRIVDAEEAALSSGDLAPDAVGTDDRARLTRNADSR
ncbi:VC0807 family protein [Actinomadura nitritigenes]|uniref:VC0807 family protein n=1 Tax=Actinomadura nitritigenes TaxID=134602 RepID=UPI003D8CEBDD